VNGRGRINITKWTNVHGRGIELWQTTTNDDGHQLRQMAMTNDGQQRMATNDNGRQLWQMVMDIDYDEWQWMSTVTNDDGHWLRRTSLNEDYDGCRSQRTMTDINGCRLMSMDVAINKWRWMSTMMNGNVHQLWWTAMDGDGRWWTSIVKNVDNDGRRWMSTITDGDERQL